MKRFFLSAVLLVLMCSKGVTAITPSLVNVQQIAPGVNRYFYDLSLATDTRLGGVNPLGVDEVIIIYDFAGYIPNSQFGNPLGWSMEQVFIGPNAHPLVGPVAGDNPTVLNLVWHWIGPPLLGPLPTVPGAPGFDLVWADSTLATPGLGKFQGQGIKLSSAIEDNTAVVTLGSVAVPVPEPSAVTLLVVGLFATSLISRRRRS